MDGFSKLVDDILHDVCVGFSVWICCQDTGFTSSLSAVEGTNLWL